MEWGQGSHSRVAFVLVRDVLASRALPMQEQEQRALHWIFALFYHERGSHTRRFSSQTAPESIQTAHDCPSSHVINTERASTRDRAWRSGVEVSYVAHAVLLCGSVTGPGDYEDR